ncbi:hypothetical protein K439DRAFT_253336 [Ramaria rubella]|nr:hypothetical protein K439DRAFT_253233 [Ramaria rubella]KAF8581115.1 hypothetical protein K439DRAFT_253336 [Ramaria rubella]
MNSICLSVAPNLRCQGLTRLENIILLVPPSIELVFSLTLALSNSSCSRKRWILVLDGVSFFLLALADFLAHVLNGASSSVDTFEIIDFVLAGASFFPIFAYMLFLFLFARSGLFNLLPARFSRVAKFSLFAIMPPIIVFNELGSLLGISHTRVQISNQTTGIAVGFSTALFQRISLFFSAGTLALFTLFQASVFSLVFIRLVRAFIDERRVESTQRDEIHLFRGIGWLAAGLKLGAIETVVGFANISFAVSITRRALRLFGRGLLIIGVIKGLNVVEDFVKFESEVMARRGGAPKKRLSRFMISNPRNSTFREMSPHASSFHAAQREKKTRVGPSPLALGAESSFNSFNDGASIRTGRERVTVQYDGKTPPVLELRFSSVDIDVHPLPQAHLLPEKPVLPVVIEDPRESYMTESYGTIPSRTSNPFTATSAITPARARMMSVASDSLEAVREIAARFPNLPPRVVPARSSTAVHPSAITQPYTDHLDSDGDSDAEWRMVSRTRSLQRREQESATGSHADISPVNSLKRKAVPLQLTSVDESHTHMEPQRGHESNTSFYSDMDEAEDGTTSSLTRVSTIETAPTSPALVSSPALHEESARAAGFTTRTIDSGDRRQIDYDNAVATTTEQEVKRQRRITQLRRELRGGEWMNDTSLDHERQEDVQRDSEVQWLQRDPLTELQKIGKSRGVHPLVPTDVEDDEAILDEAWRRAGLTRIKSMSQVRVHTTPRAQQSFDVRGSLFAIEEEDHGMEIEVDGLPEVDEMMESPIEQRVSVGSRPARLDSGVLGEEDRKLMRQELYI